MRHCWGTQYMASKMNSDVGEVQDETSAGGTEGLLGVFRGTEEERRAKQVWPYTSQNRKEKVGPRTFVAATTPSGLRAGWRRLVMGVVMGVVMGLGLRLGLGVVGPPQAAGHRATEDVPVAKTGRLEEHAACWQMRREQSSLSPSYRLIACRPRGRLKPSSRHVVILVPTIRLARRRDVEVSKARIGIGIGIEIGIGIGIGTWRRLARHVGGYKRYESQLRNMRSG